MTTQYADQRAHDVFWMTAQERNAQTTAGMVRRLRDVQLKNLCVKCHRKMFAPPYVARPVCGPCFLKGDDQ